METLTEFVYDLFELELSSLARNNRQSVMMLYVIDLPKNWLEKAVLIQLFRGVSSGIMRMLNLRKLNL